MKIYGDEKTNLVLSKKAFAVYSDTDPLKIIEEYDGTYTMHGIEERSGLSAEQVNNILECYADDDEEENKTWYAVLRDEEDDDWGTGSFDYDEAVKMALKYADGRIAVIDDGPTPICQEIILRENF